jgi:hypothetical protein
VPLKSTVEKAGGGVGKKCENSVWPAQFFWKILNFSKEGEGEWDYSGGGWTYSSYNVCMYAVIAVKSLILLMYAK